MSDRSYNELNQPGTDDQEILKYLQVSPTETLPSLMGDYTPQLSVLNKQTGQHKTWDQT